MDIKKLYEELSNHNINEELYYLHGLYGSPYSENKMNLVIVRGRYFIEYWVYEDERGEKYNLRKFLKEEEACRFFLKKILLF